MTRVDEVTELEVFENMVAILTDYIHLDRFAVRRLSFVIRVVERFPNVEERALYNRIVDQYILAVNAGTLGQDRHDIKQLLIDGRNAIQGIVYAA